MKNDKAAGSSIPAGLKFAGLLALIMALLFWKSFLPNYVHFSNDGPLGEINTAWSHFPDSLTGSWDDLNDIGTSGGASAPDLTQVASWLLGPVGFSKFYVPIAMFILGMGAWTLFRKLDLSPWASALGALATALNSCYMGNACWGTISQMVALATVFFALALVMANSETTPPLVRWARYALAGIFVGFSVMEGADNGALFSLFVAAFVFFKSVMTGSGTVLKRIGGGVGRVIVVAAFAGLIAAQTISSLLSAYVIGSSGMGDNANQMSPRQHWDWATEWSWPKKETLGVVVPGLFGYRLDTPKDMLDPLQNSYFNGEYWGGVGRDPNIDRYLDAGAQGQQPGGLMRFGYAGYYAGVLVVLVAIFGIAQSFRKENSLLPPLQRHYVWFWTAVLVIALLLSWGRFAPLYQFLYMLPYFSTIRNPVKFMAIFYLAMIIIFAYGMDALIRQYFQPAATPPKPNNFKPLSKEKETPAPTKSAWASLSGFDRKWIICSIVGFVLCVFAWFVYAGQTTGMVHYLGLVGFSDPDVAKQIFNFSVGRVGIALVFLAVAITLVILTIAGVFSGKRAILGGVFLCAFMVADLGRANLPFIVHWYYPQKYESNPVIDLLRDKPYEHRVIGLHSDSMFENLYRIEWMQQHFPYYNIQCSDVIQSSRVASDSWLYDNALAPSAPYLVARRWQLNNTEYFLGPAEYEDAINQQFDPIQRRFHILMRFDVQPKPGVDLDRLQEFLSRGIFLGEEFTAVTDTTNGQFALIDFAGALPRAKLYSNWAISTNSTAILKAVASENFDPEKTVLVTGPVPNVPNVSTGENTGTVDFKSYSPKDIVLDAQATQPSFLLLNDKYDPGWSVEVDGQPAPLLHCNFIMRGVYLTPGSHTVEFHFRQPNGPLFATLAAMAAAVALGIFIFRSTREPATATRKA